MGDINNPVAEDK